MSKREFLDTLRTQLQGYLSPAEIDGHVHYYDEYIAGEVASGKTERQVLDELGSPVLIAKTLMSASDLGASQSEKMGRDGGYYQQEEYDYAQDANENYSGHFHSFNLSPFVVKWVIPLILVLVLVVVLSLLGSVIALAARFFVPIVLVILVIAIFKSHGQER